MVIPIVQCQWGVDSLESAAGSMLGEKGRSGDECPGCTVECLKAVWHGHSCGP